MAEPVSDERAWGAAMALQRCLDMAARSADATSRRLWLKDADEFEVICRRWQEQQPPASQQPLQADLFSMDPAHDPDHPHAR